ncbi:hypothetical protein GCM10027072_26660 [Streptomyces bullii]
MPCSSSNGSPLPTRRYDTVTGLGPCGEATLKETVADMEVLLVWGLAEQDGQAGPAG